MLEQQILQLADMTVLVRGKLSNSARTTVGALTVGAAAAGALTVAQPPSTTLGEASWEQNE